MVDKGSFEQINKLIEYGMQIEIFITLNNQNNDFWSYYFDESAIIKIICFELNDKKYNYEYKNCRIKINLDNLKNEIIKIHLIYNEIYPNLCKYYRNEHIRIPINEKGLYGKIKVIIPKEYDLICFQNDLIKENENNEFIWEGIIPDEGISDFVKCSYKKAKWKIEYLEKIDCEKEINDTTIIYPKFFIGGNNKIINYDLETNFSYEIDNKNIIDDKNNFKFNFIKTKRNQVYIKLNITFENNINTKYTLNIPETKIKKYLSTLIEDKHFFYFNTFTNKIISQNKSKEEPYIKIAKWINKNISYNNNLTNKNLNPIEILAFREGICDHFTLLYSALLFSINIISIRIGGYSINERIKPKNLNLDNDGHSWNLVKINNNWIPIDTTWGIFNGKLPISHIFEFYMSGSSFCHSSDDVVRNGFIKKIQFVE